MASSDFARCPFCASVVELSATGWRKLWPFGASATVCGHCRRPISVQSAKIMGGQFAYWARQLHHEVEAAVGGLPILGTGEALGAMYPGLEKGQARPLPTFESLAQFVSQVYRTVLTDKAHGRESRLDVVVLAAEGKPALVGILGRPETGDREIEVLVTRVGRAQYLAYIPPTASPRVREAIYAKHSGPTKSPPPAPRPAAATK